MLKYTFFALSLLCASFAYATQYWVSPSGNDANTGSQSQPFTLTKGLTVAVAGDVVWVKGGLYKTTATLKFSNAGTAGNTIKLWAVMGETPVIDCADFANGTSTSRGMDIKKDFVHVKGLTIQYAGYNGIAVGASNTIIEGCVIHHCQIDGITLTNNAKNTLVLNCDSYLNWDKSDGNNGDGFSAKRGSLEGNVFRGCRAWLNSDDGWDTYGSVSPVLIDSCWAFSNGFNVFGYTEKWSGNGNGFKVGAEGPDNAENVITNSITFGNRSKGFDHNHSSCGQTVINCTGYKNQAANFSFYDNPTQGGLMKNIMRNNISYKSTVNLAPATENVTNTWDLGLPITDADFVSLDTTLALAPRDLLYRLPVTGLFRLKSNSQAVDKGTIQNNIPLKGSIPYAGKAPDLGAFEFKPNLSTALEESLVSISSHLYSRPNPFQSSSEIVWAPSQSGPATVRVYDSQGQFVKELFEGSVERGQTYPFPFSLPEWKEGLYIAVAKSGSSQTFIKLIKQ